MNLTCFSEHMISDQEILMLISSIIELYNIDKKLF